MLKCNSFRVGFAATTRGINPHWGCGVMTDRERNEKTATEDSAKNFYTAATGTDDIQAELLRDFPESLKNRDFKIYL